MVHISTYIDNQLEHAAVVFQMVYCSLAKKELLAIFLRGWSSSNFRPCCWASNIEISFIILYNCEGELIVTILICLWFTNYTWEKSQVFKESSHIHCLDIGEIDDLTMSQINPFYLLKYGWNKKDISEKCKFLSIMTFCLFAFSSCSLKCTFHLMIFCSAFRLKNSIFIKHQIQS